MVCGCPPPPPRRPLDSAGRPSQRSQFLDYFGIFLFRWARLLLQMFAPSAKRPRPDVSWATPWLLLCPLYIGKAVHVFLDVHSVKWSKPHWMTYCMLNNLLLYLCLKGCIFKVSSSREGGWGVGLMFVSSVRRQGGAWWVGGVKSNYHNWSIPRVSSSRKRTGQGLSSSKQEHFLHQSHHQSAASSFKVTLDGWYQNAKRIFFFFFFPPSFCFQKAMKLSFFAWLNVVFLLAGVSGKTHDHCVNSRRPMLRWEFFLFLFF